MRSAWKRDEREGTMRVKSFLALIGFFVVVVAIGSVDVDAYFCRGPTTPDPNTLGVVEACTGSLLCFGIPEVTLVDECVDSDSVREYWCDSSSWTGAYFSGDYDCGTGETCKKIPLGWLNWGVCAPSTSTPSSCTPCAPEGFLCGPEGRTIINCAGGCVGSSRTDCSSGFVCSQGSSTCVNEIVLVGDCIGNTVTLRWSYRGYTPPATYNIYDETLTNPKTQSTTSITIRDVSLRAHRYYVDTDDNDIISNSNVLQVTCQPTTPSFTCVNKCDIEPLSGQLQWATGGVLQGGTCAYSSPLTCSALCDASVGGCCGGAGQTCCPANTCSAGLECYGGACQSIGACTFIKDAELKFDSCSDGYARTSWYYSSHLSRWLNHCVKRENVQSGSLALEDAYIRFGNTGVCDYNNLPGYTADSYYPLPASQITSLHDRLNLCEKTGVVTQSGQFLKDALIQFDSCPAGYRLLHYYTDPDGKTIYYCTKGEGVASSCLQTTGGVPGGGTQQCGESADDCCVDSAGSPYCNNDGLVCDPRNQNVCPTPGTPCAGACVPCGADLGVCCENTPKCNGVGYVCDPNNRCVPGGSGGGTPTCGLEDRQCCTTGTPCISTAQQSLTCVAGFCRQCGTGLGNTCGTPPDDNPVPTRCSTLNECNEISGEYCEGCIASDGQCAWSGTQCNLRVTGPGGVQCVYEFKSKTECNSNNERTIVYGVTAACCSGPSCVCSGASCTQSVKTECPRTVRLKGIGVFGLVVAGIAIGMIYLLMIRRRRNI